LIDLGSPTNVPNDLGKTCLSYAHLNKNFEIIKILIDALADPREV
jgi:ankyrin repeat protein